MGYTLYTLNCRRRYTRTQFRNIENCMVAVSLIIWGWLDSTRWVCGGQQAVVSSPRKTGV